MDTVGRSEIHFGNSNSNLSSAKAVVASNKEVARQEKQRRCIVQPVRECLLAGWGTFVEDTFVECTFVEGTLVEWNIGRMEHSSNGTFVERNIGQMEHWSNEHSSNRTFV